MSSVVTIPNVSIETLISQIELSPDYNAFVQDIFNHFSPTTSTQFITQLLQAFAIYPPASAVWLAFVQNIANSGVVGLQYWQEHGSSPNIFASLPSSAQKAVATTTPERCASRGTLTAVGPNWVFWQPKVTNQEVSVAIAPSLTGAFYLSDPTVATPPNARGQNAVDLQMVRSAVTQVASGNQSFVAGLNNTASGTASVALNANTTASGLNSYAEGNQTTASGANSHAEGQLTSAIFLNSHAEGYQTTATGMGSHAEGNSTVTYGLANHAEGISTVTGNSSFINDPVLGVAAHAQGFGCQAIAANAHAGGANSVTSGFAGFSHGNGQTNPGTNCYLFGVNNVTTSFTNICTAMGENLNPHTNTFPGTTMFGQGLTAAATSDGAGHNLISSSIQLGGGTGGPGVTVTATGLSWMAFTTGPGTTNTPAVGGTWGTFNSITGTPSLASYMEWDSKQQGRLREIQESVTERRHASALTTTSHQQMKRLSEAIQSHTLGRFAFWSSQPGEHHRVCLGDYSPPSDTKDTPSPQPLATARHLGVVCPFTTGGAIFNDPMVGWAHSIERDDFNACLVDDDWVSALKAYLKNANIQMDAELKQLLQAVQEAQGSPESIEQIVTLLSQRFAADNGRMRGVMSTWALPANTVTSGDFFASTKRSSGACLTPGYRPDLWFLRCRDREQIPLGTHEEMHLLRAIVNAKLAEKATTATAAAAAAAATVNIHDDAAKEEVDAIETPKDEGVNDATTPEVNTNDDDDLVATIITPTPSLEEEEGNATPVVSVCNDNEDVTTTTTATPTPEDEERVTTTRVPEVVTTVMSIEKEEEKKIDVNALNGDALVALVNAKGGASHFFSREQWSEFCDGIQSHHVTFNGQIDEAKFVEWQCQLKARVAPGLPDLKSIMLFERATEIERVYRKTWMAKSTRVCRIYSQHDKVQFLSGLYNVKPRRVTRANPAFKPELAQSYKNRSARPHEWAMVQFSGVARVRHDGTVIAGQEVVVLADGCVSLAEQYTLSNTSAHKTYQCMRVIDETICEIFLQ